MTGILKKTIDKVKRKNEEVRYIHDGVTEWFTADLYSVLKDRYGI